MSEFSYTRHTQSFWEILICTVRRSTKWWTILIAFSFALWMNDIIKLIVVTMCPFDFSIFPYKKCYHWQWPPFFPFIKFYTSHNLSTYVCSLNQVYCSHLQEWPCAIHSLIGNNKAKDTDSLRQARREEHGLRPRHAYDLGCRAKKNRHKLIRLSETVSGASHRNSYNDNIVRSMTLHKDNHYIEHIRDNFIWRRWHIQTSWWFNWSIRVSDTSNWLHLCCCCFVLVL